MNLNHVTIPSRSLKLLPILGVPSLSREYALDLPPGLRLASSIGRRGDKGPLGRLSLVPLDAGTELVEESEV